MLSPAADVDWFSVVLAPGTHLIELNASGDATMGLGVATNATCVLQVQSATKVNAMIQGGNASLCIQVTSPTKKVQSYQLEIGF
jgi:hypothetical protein